jgi:hypothetical protein
MSGIRTHDPSIPAGENISFQKRAATVIGIECINLRVNYLYIKLVQCNLKYSQRRHVYDC